MFDSPLHFCSSCKRFVALDEGFDECQRLNGCRPETCPLTHLFETSPVPCVVDNRSPEAIALAALRA